VEPGSTFYSARLSPARGDKHPSQVEHEGLSAADVASGKVTLPEDLDDGTIAPRFALDVALATPDGWVSPPPSEHTIDLSDLAGGDAVIVLRSTFEGDVVSIPYDYRGLGVEWHDLRLGGAELRAAVARDSSAH
jgi:hypothetical protein